MWYSKIMLFIITNILLRKFNNIQNKKFYVANTKNNNADIPLKVYINAELLKKFILEENKNKSGIYRWKNNINNKTYIGSGIDLAKRIGSYYRLSELTRNSRPIDLALMKYGHNNFTLEILEYCTKDNILEREQLYLDKYEPEYNVLKKAGSLLGYKHSEETLEKLRAKIVSDETKKLISSIHSGKDVSQETRDKLSAAITKYKNNNSLSIETIEKLRAKRIEREEVAVTVINIETKEEVNFTNQTEAGLYLKVTRQAIYNAIKRNKLIDGKYKIIKK